MLAPVDKTVSRLKGGIFRLREQLGHAMDQMAGLTGKLDGQKLSSLVLKGRVVSPHNL